MSIQLDILPCKIRRYLPFPKLETATALGLALAEDGNKYIIKSNNSVNPLICANEWVCTSMADFLHIPVAPCKVLQHLNGELVFGTAMVHPLLSEIEAAQLLTSKEGRNDIGTPELRAIASAIYALDLFVGNYDRHLGNFIFSLENLNGSHEKIARIRAIDYDAATIIENADSELPLSSLSNTISIGRQIRKVHGFDSQSARTTIDRIFTGRTVIFERAMIGMPETWLPQGKRQELQKWATTSGLANRLENLSQGLGNGTYL
ncbi:HipA family kinase [Pararhizobium sp.]|uniref:HipA family kinase n=1 Tax=Pararhizobium sp. TaxID=1977563 RepID=UPI0027179CCC|nr:HipA family kinase [Pararhizobium sp.]MDO9416938.1 hypothetical protein [Pararhizobium sp.]